MKHYAERREALARRLSDGLIVVSGGKMVPRNNDVDFVFRQKSDFLYLSGIEEPDFQLVIDPKRKRHTLFIPRIDNHHRVWLGHVPGPTECRKLYGISDVRYADESDAFVRKAKAGYRKTYADGSPILRDALDELRICKLPGELALMKRASDISGRAHVEVMKRARPGMREYEIQAIFESECSANGLKHLAYPSIVAGGRNAAVLHYHRNNAVVANGSMLLVDAGAECAGYAADITRTFPINGKFTSRQRDIYTVVLDTQKKCINAARAGVVSSDLHILSMRLIADGLKQLGLLTGDSSGHVEGGAVRLFFPHGLTHTLGLDVHDTMGGKKRVMPNPTKIPVRFVARLEPGFVITMEPGVYFIESLLKDPALRSKHKGSVNFVKAEKFLDFGGVRIEDDIVVQPHGPPLNLTHVPKEIKDVEAACAKGR